MRLFLQTIAFAKVILIDGNDYHLLHLHASDFASAISEDEIIEILAEKVKDSQVPRCQRRTFPGRSCYYLCSGSMPYVSNDDDQMSDSPHTAGSHSFLPRGGITFQ